MGDAFNHFLAKLIDNLSVILVVIAAALFLLGASGGFAYGSWALIPDTAGRVTLVIGAAALLIIALQRRTAWHSSFDPTDFKFVITTPVPGEMLDKRAVAIRGTFAKKPPSDYQVRVLRIYPGSENYYPMGRAVVGAENNWELDRGDLGGTTGTRIVAVYLVGPSGQALLDYFKRAEQLHGQTLEQLKSRGGKGDDYLPLLNEKTLDMWECHRVTVNRA